MNFFTPGHDYRGTGPETQVATVETFIIPFWIRDALSRNQCDYIDILNYSRIRSMMSVEDIAQLLYCNVEFRHPVLDKLKGIGFLWEYWLKTMTNEQQQEFNAIIRPLSYAETTATAFRERLFNQETNNSNAPAAPSPEYEELVKKACRFQATNDGKIFIFIDRYISNAFEDRGRVKSLVSDYLKVLYSLLPIREVSRYSAFKLYIDLL